MALYAGNYYGGRLASCGRSTIQAVGWRTLLQFDGDYYGGSHQIRARNQRRAEELISGWKGRMVVVRYSPAKHEISVLLKSDQPAGQSGNT